MLANSAGIVAGRTRRRRRSPVSPVRVPPSCSFPLEEFRTTCEEVIHGPEAQTILQLGSPSGYRAPAALSARAGAGRRSRARFRRHPDHQRLPAGLRLCCSARWCEKAKPCCSKIPSIPAANRFERAGARLIGVPVGRDGIDLESLERVVERERPRLLAVTSNFQNPTGATLPLAARKAAAAHRAGRGRDR